MRLEGGSAGAELSGEGELPGRINYLLGNEPARWHTGLATYKTVRYESVYPGVDLLFYGNQQALEYDFVVQPGADPRQIRLEFEGAEKLTVAESGDLVIGVAGGDEFRFHKPEIYQPEGSERRKVEGSFVVHGKRASFALSPYDETKPLVIDPVLVYSSYFGGMGAESCAGYQNLAGVAIDSVGDAYILNCADGTTVYPITPGAYQPTMKGPTDVVIAKFNPAGNSLIYATYLGGNGYEFFGNHNIAADGTGNVYVSGNTSSTDYPTTPGAYQTGCVPDNFGECSSVFFSKLSADGSRLLYSTYLGGSTGAKAYTMALDSAGHAYIEGATKSTDFPITPDAFEPVPLGYCFAPFFMGGFLTELDPSATGTASLKYSTYIQSQGVSSNGCAPVVTGLAVDTSTDVFMTGYDWVVVNNMSASFVAELNLSKSGPGALTGLYPLQGDRLTYGIATDNQGFAYIAGGYYDHALETAFVAKLNVATGTLVYEQPFGVDVLNEGRGIAVDGAGNAYVAGYTSSSSFPLLHPIQPWLGTPGSDENGFIVKLDPAGNTLYSTYFGEDAYFDIAVDASGNAYIGGFVLSPGSVPVVNAFQGAPAPTLNTPFFAKISSADEPGIGFRPGSRDFGQIQVNYSSDGQGVTLVAAGDQNLTINSISTIGDFTQTNGCPATLAPTSSCSVLVNFQPTAPGPRTGSVVVQDNAPGSPHTIALSGVGVGPGVSLSPSTLDFGHLLQGGGSPPQTITLTNSGNAALVLISITSNSSSYTTTSTCPINQQMPVGAQCTISVIFTPKGTGTQNGQILVASNASSAQATATGIGTNFTLSLAPASATVTPGHSILSTATVSPISGFTGPVDLSCSVPNSSFTCLVRPVSVTVGQSAIAAQVSLGASNAAPGTYRLTLSAKSGSVVHTATFTLTVSLF
jgi:hypothetical protein